MRGWDSNPRSRAHEAREDSRSPTAQSVWLESNQRSPVPETGGVTDSPTDRCVVDTPGGSRTRCLPVESRASSPVDHGGVSCTCSSGGRARTCASRVTVARLAARPHRNETEAAGFEPADGSPRLRGSGALPCLARPCLRVRAEGEGVEPPRPAGPTRFRDGIPHRWQSFPEWPRQGSNLQPSA